MFNKKYRFAFALFLLLPLSAPVFAQEQPPAGVAAGAGVQAQHQKTPFSTFDGIVVQADPLEVKSVTGEVRTFLPPKREASSPLQAAWPKPGNLVSLTYEPGPNGNILKEIRIDGATVSGTIKEIAADMSWLSVR
ncbi:MAG: hypothetical protein L0H75_10500, partial [Nitrosospira sp.]|nr:hypothetical protein [Nitrosospira sp.]